LDVHTFKKSIGNATILALPGILIAILLSAGLTMGLGFLNLGFTGWSWIMALILGAVVSATDPVAVVAILKELGAGKKLATLIEGESLLNDGTAIVIFFILIGMLPFGLELYHTDNPLVFEFLRVSIGGILLGLIIGGITLIWVRKVFNDALVEITLIVIAAYLTFFIAEHFLHVSGVLGLVALGLSMASAGKTRISAEVQHFLHDFWELASFIANTLIFIIVGVVIAKRVVFTVNEFAALFILHVGLHLIRAIVFIVFYPAMKNIGYGLNIKDAVVAWFGGLRGAISLALALLFVGAIQRSNPGNNLIILADQFLFFVAGIVVLTLLINASTIKFLIKALGLTKIPPVKAVMFSNAFDKVRHNTLKELQIIQKDRFMTAADWESVNKYLPEPTIAPILEEDIIHINPLFEGRRRMLEKEKSSYWRQYKDGLLGSLAYTVLANSINDIIDKNGTLPLDQRDYLDSIMRVPRLYMMLQRVSVFKTRLRKFLLNRLAMNYDVARGFVVAQEEVLKLASSMDFKCNHVDNNDEKPISNAINEEIKTNRLNGLRYIENIHLAYSEIVHSIETRQATRSVLNFEKANIIRLKNEGRFEDDEAKRLILSVEKRMQKLLETPINIKLPDPHEVLKDVYWLRNLPETSLR
jgi:NhaP-type Na+/H+ or K+/H+ antiporter